MKLNLDQNEIDKLENVLENFKQDWEQQQAERAKQWRFNFLTYLALVLLISVILPSLWWLNIVVVGYFAGSLFTMLRGRVRTNKQIIEHQKQLRLIRLLRKFDASPYSDSQKH